MEDLEEPQSLLDPQDPLRPDIDEEHGRTPPMADAKADMDTAQDELAADSAADAAEDDHDDASERDVESELDELDEREFEDFDPSALNIPDKPVQVDAENVGLLGVHKRKRTEEEERERKKKKKEGKREKAKRGKKTRDADETFDGGEEVDGKRARRSALGADGRPAKPAKRARTPENEENLTPDERRRRALDRKMDEALKTHRTSRRRAGVDLESMADAEIENMRQRMAKACELDAEARARGDVATHKLKILPDVVELMNRNTIQAQLVDPDINILEAVRFMLEPADHDAALPNHQIQRELFSIMSKLNIGKEALVASGIGKVVLFYTKSIQPQPEIKRQAEKLIGEWMRVVLKKGKNMRNKPVETRVYDPLAASARSQGAHLDKAAIAAERRRKALAAPVPGNRARVEGGLGTYTIAPVNNLTAGAGMSGSGRRQGTGDDTFKRIAARGAMKAGKR